MANGKNGTGKQRRQWEARMVPMANGKYGTGKLLSRQAPLKTETVKRNLQETPRQQTSYFPNYRCPFPPGTHHFAAVPDGDALHGVLPVLADLAEAALSFEEAYARPRECVLLEGEARVLLPVLDRMADELARLFVYKRFVTG